MMEVPRLSTNKPKVEAKKTVADWYKKGVLT